MALFHQCFKDSGFLYYDLYICVCACVRVHLWVYFYIHTHTHIHTHTLIKICIYLCVCVCVCVFPLENCVILMKLSWALKYLIWIFQDIYIYMYMYIYIYIYIIEVLVVTILLRGFVANQMQCNLKSAKYLWQSYYIIIISKVGDHSWGWLEGSLFNCYHTEVLGRALLHSLDCSHYSWYFPYNAQCFNYHFLSLWYD